MERSAHPTRRVAATAAAAAAVAQGSSATGARTDGGRGCVSAATVVLVHGAWHDASSWDRVMPLLDAAGVSWRALDLPSVHPLPALPGLADDVAAVTALVDDVGGPVVLVGHSYGGVVISAVGHHSRVRHLVYLSAFAPDEGETVLEIGIGDPPPLTVEAVRFGDDGTMTIDPALAVATFYDDVERTEADRRAAALRATTAAVFTDPAGPPAWRTVSSTAVVCTVDRAISVDRLEQMAARTGGDIVRWVSSHSPFLSRPNDVAALLARLADAP
jgi:pimeloyl-ACP methyl ester carboxylesterase